MRRRACSDWVLLGQCRHSVTLNVAGSPGRVAPSLRRLAPLQWASAQVIMLFRQPRILPWRAVMCPTIKTRIMLEM